MIEHGSTTLLLPDHRCHKGLLSLAAELNQSIMVCTLPHTCGKAACVLPLSASRHRPSSPQIAACEPAIQPPILSAGAVPTPSGISLRPPRRHLGRCAAQAEPAAPSKTKIGWLGLGIMGTAMVRLMAATQLTCGSLRLSHRLLVGNQSGVSSDT